MVNEASLIGIIGAMMLAPFVTSSANAADDFELKISGYFQPHTGRRTSRRGRSDWK